MTLPVTSVAKSGGSTASIAAVKFWIDCVRREHHGYKFNSYPALFAALDGADAAADAKDPQSLIRQAKCAHELFRQDAYAYWPRLEVCWLSAQRFRLLFNPAWYFISKVVYPGYAFLNVVVQTKPDWQCQVVWSAQRTESGPFPAFNALTDRQDLDWFGHEEPSDASLDTRVLSYDTPSSQWPF